MKTKKNRLLRKLVIVIVLTGIACWIFVLYANRNSKNMTARQMVLKAVYPAFMWLNSKTGKNNNILFNEKAVPSVSFYALSATGNDGKEFKFNQLKGRKVLLVNTASNCGYTGQYDDLQKLSDKYKEKLVVIGFPSNDFKEQEKGNDTEIARFCRINFGVTFPLMQKSSVIKGEQQNSIYAWLTNPEKNGWNKQQPVWNFCKYLVDENGHLTHYFGPAVEPLGADIAAAINR